MIIILQISHTIPGDDKDLIGCLPTCCVVSVLEMSLYLDAY